MPTVRRRNARMKIRILGAGPAGLWLARSLKRRNSKYDIAIVEQNPAGATYGFGVVFSSAALNFLEQSDPDALAELKAQMEIWDGMTVVHRNQSVSVDGGGFAGIERLALLRTLQKLCESSGIDIRYGRRVDAIEELGDADLVVAADGTNSIIRSARASDFETHRSELTNRFCWFGTATPFATNTLTFKQHDGGNFVAHHYRYRPNKSTFLVECDEATWAGSGLAAMDDAQRKAFSERIFCEELEGQPLIENNSVWRRFPVVYADRWHAGNHVLIGDALRSAHYSIGSGTRLAIDDAIALSDAILETTSVGDALDAYEERRRPTVDRFREAARRSYEWYEQLPEKMELAPMDLVHDFMQRTGRVDEARLRRDSPFFMQAYEQYRLGAAREIRT
jgi:2-polyprenyl-6-methoxyphenol hydroxylase-like FAD-dependent oxidoreductase